MEEIKEIKQQLDIIINKVVIIMNYTCLLYTSIREYSINSKKIIMK